MPLVREAGDVELGSHGSKPVDQTADFPPQQEPRQRKCSNPYRWIGSLLAIAIAAVLLGTIIPAGLKDRRQPSTGTPNYKWTGGRALNTSLLFDPMAGLRANETLDCAAVAGDMPNITLPAGSPPPPLKAVGDRLVTPDGKDAAIHGINWFGFNNGKTMVDGLDAERTPSWEGGDFATIVQTLKLLGFNAVRLPFLFGDLFGTPPQDYAKRCPDARPTAAALAQRATNPAARAAAAGAAPPAVPAALAAPPGSEPGVCNAYLPNSSTLARFLWVVRYLVSSGMYVVVDYHPEPGHVEPVLDSVDAFTRSWLKLWLALSCGPEHAPQLAGRVLLDLMNEPDGAGITWDGGASGTRKPLGDYYLAAMDAITQQAGKGGAPLFLIQGAGQAKLGSNWGDGFVTDKTLLAEHKLSDPNAFFSALVAKPYASRVVLSPHLYGPSLSGTKDIGPAQWQKYAASWGTLAKRGYCPSSNSSSNSSSNATAVCQKFPVLIGEVGSNFTLPADEAYFANLVKFMRAAPPAGGDEYPTTPFNRWAWWAYNANTREVGGVVGPDWQTLDWKKLGWMQQNLGLGRSGAAAAPAAAAAAAAAAKPAPAAADAAAAEAPVQAADAAGAKAAPAAPAAAAAAAAAAPAAPAATAAPGQVPKP